MNDNTDREALALHYDPQAFEDHPIERRSMPAAIQWAARRKLAQDAADRVLGSGWFAEHDKRVRAEQAETDARIGHDAAAQWVDEWQPNSHKNSHIEDYVAAAIREASDER